MTISWGDILIVLAMLTAGVLPAEAREVQDCQTRFKLNWNLSRGEEMLDGKKLVVVIIGSQENLVQAQPSIEKIELTETKTTFRVKFETFILPLFPEKAFLIATAKPYRNSEGRDDDLTARLCEIAISYKLELQGWEMLNGTSVVGGSFSVLNVQGAK